MWWYKKKDRDCGGALHYGRSCRGIERGEASVVSDSVACVLSFWSTHPSWFCQPCEAAGLYSNLKFLNLGSNGSFHKCNTSHRCFWIETIVHIFSKKEKLHSQKYFWRKNGWLIEFRKHFLSFMELHWEGFGKWFFKKMFLEKNIF